MKCTYLLAIAVLVLAACHRKKQADDPAIWQKVKIDLSRLDAEGLAGPPSGKVALDYEFCIPGTTNAWQQVQKIDPSAKKHESRGRVGCNKGTYLVIGNTHQKNFRRVLYELARLNFVSEIRETHWE